MSIMEIIWSKEYGNFPFVAAELTQKNIIRHQIIYANFIVITESFQRVFRK